MNGNLLLLYLSEMGNGRWAKFTDALNVLSAPWGRSTHALQLQMLAHVEFDFLNDPMRWSVTPPVLAWLPRHDTFHRAVLCGRRTERFLTNLQRFAQDVDCILEIKQQENNPDAIFVVAKESYQIDNIAERLRIGSEPKSAERLAHCLPCLDDYLALCPMKPEPHGYGIKKLNLAQGQWVEVERTDGTGLFEYDCVEGRQYRLRIEGQCRQTPRDFGIYALLNHLGHSILRYDDRVCELVVPAFANLPILFARAATLCSGLLPQYDYLKKAYRYQGVTTAVAYAILTKLNQETQFT